MTTRALGMVVLATWLAVGPRLAHAQDELDDEDEVAADDEGSADEPDADQSAEAGEAGEDAGASDEGEGGAEGKAAATAARSWYFGPYVRYKWVPAFMLELFLEQAPTLGNGAVGVVADYRSSSGAPTLEIGLGYSGYHFAGPMQAKGDPETDTEWVESDLGLIHVTGSVLWEAKIVEDKLSFEYGIGLDLGVLTGNVVRTEAYKENGVFHKCPTYDFTSAYCEPPQDLVAGTDAYNEQGAHYGVVEKRVPPIGGALMLPHLALRWAPTNDLAVKLEAAYGIVDLWIGLSAAYAPNI